MFYAKRFIFKIIFAVTSRESLLKPPFLLIAPRSTSSATCLWIASKALSILFSFKCSLDIFDQVAVTLYDVPYLLLFYFTSLYILLESWFRVQCHSMLHKKKIVCTVTSSRVTVYTGLYSKEYVVCSRDLYFFTFITENQNHIYQVDTLHCNIYLIAFTTINE